MHTIKGAVFSLRDVVARMGDIDQDILGEVVRLFRFLLSVNVQPVLVSNSEWTVNFEDGTQKLFPDWLSELVGTDIPYLEGGRDIDYKQYASAMDALRGKFGWVKQEVVYVGSTDDDMRAARNGGLLYLRADWHETHNPYGFSFDSPKAVAQFIECCCLIPQNWFWAIEDQNLRCYCIAPFGEYSSTYPEAAIYSTDAKGAVKEDVGHKRFWGLLMAARIHCSGIGEEAKFVAPYPGHKTTSKKADLMDAIAIVSGSLRAQYVVDMIQRHTDAQKSQDMRNKGLTPDCKNQLSTIHLRRKPTKPGQSGSTYKHPPSLKGKKVLIVDDICTEGFSLEAARAFVEAGGGEAILLTWLKTPGKNDYHEIVALDPPIKNRFAPFPPGNVSEVIHRNSHQVKNYDAAKEIGEAFTRYCCWDWPTGL